MKAAFHEREAKFHADEHRKTGDAWSVVNASGHYRKCKKPELADKLLTSIPAAHKKNARLSSAICTTHGGVMRDLGRLSEALKLGGQAHALTPKDFRPCTLLGAVSFEMEDYDEGRDWYAMAGKRGASERSIDDDLRGLLRRADKARREDMKAFLLSDDPVRYRWVRDF